MSKRKVDDYDEPAPPEQQQRQQQQEEEDPMIQRARELYSEKADSITHIYVCTEAILKKILKETNSPNPSKDIKLLQHPRTIHTVHPVVVKRQQTLRFRFCPSELGKDGRCLVPLTAVLNILPCSPEEVEKSAGRPMPEKLDISRFVLHSFEVTHSSNNSPFQLLFRSNMFDVVLQSLSRFQSGERLMRAISEAEPLVMPDLPTEVGTLVLDPNEEKDYKPREGDKPGEGACVNPFGYIEPENTRVALSTSDVTNSNGIKWIDWRAPKSNQTTRHGVLSKEHVITMAARANFDEYYINIVALNTVEEADTYYTLIPADMAKQISDDFVARQQNTVPICDTNRVMFEICRQIGGTNWTSPRGAGGMTTEGFKQTYEAVIVFDMSYTLISSDIGNAVVTMPTAALPGNVMENELELREAIDKHVAEQIDEEMTMFDLEKLRVDNDDE